MLSRSVLFILENAHWFWCYVSGDMKQHLEHLFNLSKLNFSIAPLIWVISRSVVLCCRVFFFHLLCLSLSLFLSLSTTLFLFQLNGFFFLLLSHIISFIHWILVNILIDTVAHIYLTYNSNHIKRKRYEQMRQNLNHFHYKTLNILNVKSSIK